VACDVGLFVRASLDSPVTVYWASAGMFSTMFGRPNYQDEAVQNYLNTANPPTSMFNTTGRGCTYGFFHVFTCVLL